MTGNRGRRQGPSDPAVIAAAAAAARAAKRLEEKRIERDPGSWGVNVAALDLPTAANTNIAVGNNRDRVISARRSDAFDLMYAAKGLTQAQHQAGRRLFRDWCARAGVRDAPRAALPNDKVDGGRWDLSDRITQAQVDAGKRIQFVLDGVGPVNARILTHQISPVVDGGRDVLVWRVMLEQATGEKNKDAQGALLRQACECTRLMYDRWDALVRELRDKAA